MVKKVAIRTVLTVVVTNNWILQQLDIKNAFINEIIQEEVFIEQPKGFVHHQRSDHV